ncbi:MAG: YHYH protein [Bacteroidetes bacterium]|nr:MAG: YHYH protein [Bacteroidota bacterium]
MGNPDVRLTACTQPDGYVANADDTDDDYTVLPVNPDYFTQANPQLTVSKVPCTLSDGTETECYQIVTTTIPTDHPVGPWCPDHITDDASAGGIWIDNGEVYDVDGAFIEHLATFYNDTTWHMYDADGNIYVTRTLEDCINAANPDVGEEYKNYCVECLPSYISDLTTTFLIPVTPVRQDQPTFFLMGPGGPPGAPQVPSTRGIALNGVEFSAPAPLNAILGAYTLAPFDDAGGHINVHQGYHYHAATGLSYAIEQPDGHAPLIGYAIDGHGIYARLDANGNEPDDLDECRGHYDELRGYHYHVDKPGNNNFINCIRGAYAD